MKLRKISLKRILTNLVKIPVGALIAYGFIFGTVHAVNSGDRIRPNFSSFDINEDCTWKHFKHVSVCGENGEKLEYVYTTIQKLLGATDINKKVNVYVANTFEDQNTIGKVGNTYVSGVYYKGIFGQPDTIIYNGLNEVFMHELSHLFFEYMSKSRKSESFAQLFDGRLLSEKTRSVNRLNYMNLEARYSNLRRAFVDEMGRWARECSKNKREFKPYVFKKENYV